MTDPAAPTPFEALNLFAEGLLEELEDEHSCTEVGLYRLTLADIQDEAEAATRSTPAEPLDVLRDLEGWARSHSALRAGRGNVDDIEGFIAWYRARHTEGAD